MFSNCEWGGPRVGGGGGGVVAVVEHLSENYKSYIKHQSNNSEASNITYRTTIDHLSNQLSNNLSSIYRNSIEPLASID